MESFEEHISSLVFPYMNFVFGLFENKKETQSYELCNLIGSLFTHIIIKDNQISLK